MENTVPAKGDLSGVATSVIIPSLNLGMERDRRTNKLTTAMMTIPTFQLMLPFETLANVSPPRIQSRIMNPIMDAALSAARTPARKYL